MLVQDFLENSADRLPEKVALVCDSHAEQKLNYTDIAEGSGKRWKQGQKGRLLTDVGLTSACPLLIEVRRGRLGVRVLNGLG